MIAHLSGTLLYKDQKHAVIQTGGVGYKVYATERDLELMRVTEQASVWVYTAVKEDALDLYGFILRDCKDMFDHLLTISGVGPKTALNILNTAGHEAIISAVLTGEISYITAVGGVGKKMAEKIVLELKGKLAAIEHIDPITGEKTLTGLGAVLGAGVLGALGAGYGDLAGATQSDIDTIEALKSLGYTHREAKIALEKLDAETRAKDIGEKIKVLLKVLG
jgi:Holliday junction DNA helicase RuvA